MAHYVAELIVDVEHASRPTRREAQSRCAGAILELWAHRWEFPPEKNPFSDLLPVVRTLEALDPEAEHPFYRELYRPSIPPRPPSEIEQWLEFARGVDQSARLLIDHLLGRASAIAVEKGLPWARVAEHVGTQVDVDLVVLLAGRLDERYDLNEERRKIIRNRIERIDNLIELSKLLKSELESELTIVASTSTPDL
jgi:hypothetical protein